MNRLLILTLLFTCFSIRVSMAQDFIITNENDTIVGRINEHTLTTVSFLSQSDNKKRKFRVGRIKGFSSNGFSYSTKKAGQGDMFLLDHFSRDTSYYTSTLMHNVLVKVSTHKDLKVYHVITGVGGLSRSGAPMTFPDHRYLLESKELGLRDVFGSDIAYENLKRFFAGHTILLQDILLTNGKYGSRFLDKLLENYAAGGTSN